MVIALSSPLLEQFFLQVGVPVCVAPWISFEVAGFAVGTAGITVGV